nr:hypothetical protein [Tanacetum cinerariifolium]
MAEDGGVDCGVEVVTTAVAAGWQWRRLRWGSVVREAREGMWLNGSDRSEWGEQFWFRRKKLTGKLSGSGGVVAGWPENMEKKI